MSTNTLLRDRLSLAAESFFTAKQGEQCSPRTLEAYRRSVGMFADWLRGQGVTQPGRITPGLVRSYFADLGTRGFKSSTVHDYARPVKTFVRFLYTDDILTVDVMAKVKMPRQEKKILPALAREDVRAILAACTTDRDTALVMVMLDTGLRAAELCALKVGDFNVKTGAVLVRHGKGGKDRVVYAGAKTRRAVIRYMTSRVYRDDDDMPLFPSDKGGRHLTTNGLLIALHRIGKRAGVAHCNPHAFRRTFALWSLRSGMDLMRLAALMGHADLAVLRQYLDLNHDDLAAAHKEHGAVDALL